VVLYAKEASLASPKSKKTKAIYPQYIRRKSQGRVSNLNKESPARVNQPMYSVCFTVSEANKTDSGKQELL